MGTDPLVGGDWYSGVHIVEDNNTYSILDYNTGTFPQKKVSATKKNDDGQ